MYIYIYIYIYIHIYIHIYYPVNRITEPHIWKCTWHSTKLSMYNHLLIIIHILFTPYINIEVCKTIVIFFNFIPCPWLGLYIFFFLDIDRCLPNPCHPNATCVPKNDSFICLCNNDFSGNEKNCTGNTDHEHACSF